MKLNVFKLTILSTILTFAQCEQNEPIVSIANVGAFLGSTTTTAWNSFTVFQFRGVRYGEPPTGNRRFKAPVLAVERSGIQNAQRVGRQCPNMEMISSLTHDEIVAAEDCLHMSIYTKNLTGKQPVMVYIHGGGFYEGDASHHPPNYLLEKDVVLVVPQYRLGLLGFLSTNTTEIPGNVAVLDVILALQWVHKHISHFGGTSNSITLFGQSAGAAMAAALLYSPNTPPNLFHKVILQSGSAMSTWAFDSNYVTNAKELAKLAGCTNLESIHAINSCFMTMDTKTMLETFLDHLHNESLNLAEYGGAKFVCGPSTMFPLHPSELSENAAYKDIPILAGATKHDGSFMVGTFFDYIHFIRNGTELSDHHYITNFLVEKMNDFLGIPDDTGSIAEFQRDLLFSREIIENGDFHKMLPGLIDIASVVMFKGPILKMFQHRHKSNNLFLYSFDYDGEFTRFGYGADTTHYPFKGGIHHSNDNIYLFPFPSFASKLNKKDTKMSKTMVDFWTSFAATGTPTSANCRAWPAFSTHYGPYLHINERCTIGNDYFDEFSAASREAKSGSMSFDLSNTLWLTGIFLILKQLSLFNF